MNGMIIQSGWSFGGSDGGTQSLFIGFAPTFTIAGTTLNQASGDGLAEIGIAQFTSRPPGQATDNVTNFGPFQWDGNSSIPAVIDAAMTSVTADIWTGGGDHQTAAGTLSVYFW